MFDSNAMVVSNWLQNFASFVVCTLNKMAEKL